MMLDALHLVQPDFGDAAWLSYDEQAKRNVLVLTDYQRGVRVAVWPLPGQTVETFVQMGRRLLAKAQPLDGHRAPVGQMPLPLEMGL